MSRRQVRAVRRRVQRTLTRIDQAVARRLAEGVPAGQVADEVAAASIAALDLLPAEDAAVAKPLLQARIRALLDRDDP